MGNPDDGAGTWPAGTRIANSNSVGALRYSFYSAIYTPSLDTWFRSRNYIGGVDQSGTNERLNFPPGTAFVRPFWLPNFSNRSGGWSGHPDTGTSHATWFTGVSVRVDPHAVMKRADTGADSGKFDLRVPEGDFDTGSISLVTPPATLTEV